MASISHLLLLCTACIANAHSEKGIYHVPVDIDLPFSKGVGADLTLGNIYFTSGQIGTKAGEAFEAQFRQAMENLESSIKAGGGSLKDVMKTTGAKP